MKTQLSKQHLTTYTPYATPNQKPLVLNSLKQGTSQMYSGYRNKQKAKDAFTQTNIERVVALYPNMLNDIKEIKQYADELLQYDYRTFDLQPNGHFVITPDRRFLPNEIIHLILQHLLQQHATLYQCALASKCFYAIANPLLWQSPVFNNNARYIRFIQCLLETSVLRRRVLGKHIRELRIAGIAWTDTYLGGLLPNLQFLKHISMSASAQITFKSFRYLPRSCQHITSLCLSGTRLTKMAFFAIGQHCHQLCDLEWDLSKKQSAAWLEMLNACPLKRLRIDASHVILDGNAMASLHIFEGLTSMDITLKAWDRTTLLQLLAPPGRRGRINSSYKTTGVWWPQLTTLALQPCDAIDPITFVSFLRSHPHLQQLHVKRATQLTDDCLQNMAGMLPRLTRLTLTDNPIISPEGIQRFIRQGLCLEHIAISFCTGIKYSHFPEAVTAALGGIGNIEFSQEAIHKIRQRPEANKDDGDNHNNSNNNNDKNKGGDN